jgi:hypothetical protein
MSESWLNANQRRRLGTHLQLLQHDLAALIQAPGLRRPGTPFDRIRDIVAQVDAEIAAVRREFAIVDDRGPSLRRQAGAVAEVWSARVEDLRARRLRGGGEVHPRLGPLLDPHIDRLGVLLSALSDAAATLPDA